VLAVQKQQKIKPSAGALGAFEYFEEVRLASDLLPVLKQGYLA
jgi:hypothetical protein